MTSTFSAWFSGVGTPSAAPRLTTYPFRWSISVGLPRARSCAVDEYWLGMVLAISAMLAQFGSSAFIDVNHGAEHLAPGWTTAIGLCKLFDIQIIVTCGSAEKCAAATALGADLAVDYSAEDYVEAIAALADTDFVAHSRAHNAEWLAWFNAQIAALQIGRAHV